MIYNKTLNDYGKIYNSCTLYIILLVIAFSIIIGIGSVYIYFYWYLKISNTGVNNSVNTSVNTETLIYQRYKW